MESMQNTKKDGYKSSSHKLITFFKNSRDKWKERVVSFIISALITLEFDKS